MPLHPRSRRPPTPRPRPRGARHGVARGRRPRQETPSALEAAPPNVDRSGGRTSGGGSRRARGKRRRSDRLGTRRRALCAQTNEHRRDREGGQNILGRRDGAFRGAGPRWAFRGAGPRWVRPARCGANRRTPRSGTRLPAAPARAGASARTPAPRPRWRSDPSPRTPPAAAPPAPRSVEGRAHAGRYVAEPRADPADLGACAGAPRHGIGEAPQPDPRRTFSGPTGRDAENPGRQRGAGKWPGHQRGTGQASGSQHAPGSRLRRRCTQRLRGRLPNKKRPAILAGRSN